ncbi:hypothetical protein BDW62DRAFT_216886 [Aspergillus aurantiobrunneus]
MTTLTTLPEELIALVLRSCDSFSQLHSLIRTCKTLHAVWEANQRIILWHVGQAAIPGFGDALIASRATQISQSALLRHTLPPTPFPSAQLPGTTTKPTLHETHQALTLTPLAQHLSAKTRSPLGKTSSFLPHRWFFETTTWTPRTWHIWTDSYHRAVYRYLAGGAILSRAYHEPVISPAKPAGFLASLVKILEGIAVWDASTASYPGWFSDEERRYLASVPLYNSQRHAEWGGPFTELEGVFLHESKQQSSASSGWKYTPQPGEGLETSLFRLFGSKAKNPRALDAAHAEALFEQLLQFLYLVDGDMRCLVSLPGDTPVENTEGRITHSMSAFLFGSFTPMRINIRRKEEDGGDAAFASPVLPKLESKMLESGASQTEYLGFANMHNFLKKVWDVGGLPNCYGDPVRKTVPPVGFFVEYMLRKYFGLRFAHTMFDSTMEVRCAWYAFHQYGGVFTGYGPRWYVGQDLLQSVDDPSPVPCYDEYAWYY